MELLNVVTTGLRFAIIWVGTVLSSFLNTGWSLNGLLPLFCIGIAVSVLLFAVKAIKSLIWGS